VFHLTKLPFPVIRHSLNKQFKKMYNVKLVRENDTECIRPTHAPQWGSPFLQFSPVSTVASEAVCIQVQNYQEGLIDSRVIQVMGHGSNDGCKNLKWLQFLENASFLEETVHGLSNVGSVDCIVIRIPPVISIFNDG
jgi:hypothetical protein